MKGAEPVVPQSRSRRGRGAPTRLAQRAVAPSGQKLSVEQRSQVLDWLARGWTLIRIQHALIEAGGPQISHQALSAYQKRHPEEIRQKRDRWIAELRGDPLAVPRDRVRELLKMYGVGVLSQYRELCPDCGGDGVLPVLRTPKDERGRTIRNAEPVKGNTRCERCRGRKWILPVEVQRVLAATGGDIRFETLPDAPPAVDPEGLDACRDLLRQIREEVGDAWSPRENATKPEEHTSGGVNMVVITGNKEEYIAQLRALRGAPPLPALPVEASPASAGGNGGPPIPVQP